MHNSFAQTDYRSVDIFVENLEIRTKKAEKIAKILTAPFEGNDSLKARAIFKWISQTIDYDVKEFNRRKFSNKLKLRKQSIKAVLKRKKAVCAGYANLFEAIAKKSGLEVVTIIGIAKSDIGEIGDVRLKSNHAWNAVKIDGIWRLIDVTWGSGGVNKKDQYVREMKDYYFFSNPAQFVVNHFPDKVEWQLLHEPILRGAFIHFPIPHDAFFRQNFTFMGNTRYGFLQVSEDKEYTLDFQNNLKAKKYDVLTLLIQEVREKVWQEYGWKMEIVRKETWLDHYLQEEGEKYSLYCEFTKVGKYEMHLYLNREPLLSYWLKVHKLVAPGRLDK